ncbi:hypothetical protein [Nitrobacter sp. JJSN]|uniref:hypothetical protein n=1 Tax=Nitrobacter sp. JJSN TaxID=3453033 RepID=UPI003F76CD9F
MGVPAQPPEPSDYPRHQSFGGTIIGGGIALVWAMRTAHRSGESGLINDVKREFCGRERPYFTVDIGTFAWYKAGV